jgi:hypothetical protein
MGLLSRVLRNIEKGGLGFFCPGCREMHVVWTGEGPGPRWGWNGNAEKPTFTPSVLVTGRGFTDAGEAAFEAWHAAGCPKPAPQFESQDKRCHTFVTDGRIQFLSDCTHPLAGQTVNMVDVPSPRVIEG